MLQGLYGSSAAFPVSPSTPSPTFKLKTIFVWEAADIFFQERGTYNIVLWFCLMYHPSCETIRASFIFLALVQIHCPLTQSSPCSPLHLLLTLLLRPSAGRDTVCFHLLLTSVKRGSAQHPAGSGLFSFALRLNPHKLQGMPCSDLIVGFLGTCPQLSPEEEEKRRIRRERNKLAAAKCRNRRRELTEKLQAVCALHRFFLPCCPPFGPAQRALLFLH